VIADNDIKQLLREIAYKDCETAYKKLFTRTYDNLLQFAGSFLHNTPDAEEVVSDCFIQLWRNRQRLTQIDKPKLYLYTSIKNGAINKLKANKARSLPDPAAWAIRMDSVFFNPQELLLSAEFTAKIMTCIDQMPPKCKLIFKLVKEEGLRYAEVATLLNLSVKTIEAQMAIAFRRLKNCIQFENEFPEIHSLLSPKK
jgi:RNA polymerase sigma-70 factor (family 1)